MSDESAIVPVELAPDAAQVFLNSTALFHQCEPGVLQRVASVLSAFHYPAGSEVLTPGVTGEAIGFVYAGRVSVRVPGAAVGEPPFEMLLPGESLCEMSAFPGAVWPYSAVAEDDTQVLWLGTDDAQLLASRVPAFAAAVGSKMSTQLARAVRIERRPAAIVAPGEFHASGGAQPFDPRSPGSTGPAIPFVELRDYDIQPTVLTMLPLKLIRQHRMLPVRLSDRRLTVAMVAPRNVAAIADARRALAGVELEVVAISQDDFLDAVTKFKLDEARMARGPKAGPSINPDLLVYEAIGEESAAAAGPAARSDEVIRFVNRVIVAGLDREASDIHLEPGAGPVRVRFRIQGLLSDWSEGIPPGCTSRAVAARIKVLAGMDITEKRMPQDGRIGVTIGKRDVDLRVSSIPCRGGEKLALRILEGAGSTRPLDQIFLEPGILGAVRRALERPYGGILIGGPTGSGKTSTLYSLLHERQLARPDSNVMMVEDPIEYRVQGATQVQINAAQGLGFAEVLRAMMRQDPDVIVVGEMRDAMTAQLALESAMTGHLLLSSLHANDSRSVLQRLESLGCTRAVMAQSLTLILVQRLVRRLCNSCRVVDAPPPALLETLIVRGIVDRDSGAMLPRAVGCDACNGTGYGGRIVVMDSLQITDPVRNALAAGRPLEEIERLAFTENALLPFSAYATSLLSKQLIGAGEVLATLAD